MRACNLINLLVNICSCKTRDVSDWTHRCFVFFSFFFLLNVSISKYVFPNYFQCYILWLMPWVFPLEIDLDMSYWRMVNIGLINGLVPPGTLTFAKPILIKIHDSIWHHQEPMSWGWVTHICISKLTIICPDPSPGVSMSVDWLWFG